MEGKIRSRNRNRIKRKKREIRKRIEPIRKGIKPTSLMIFIKLGIRKLLKIKGFDPFKIWLLAIRDRDRRRDSESGERKKKRTKRCLRFRRVGRTPISSEEASACRI